MVRVFADGRGMGISFADEKDLIEHIAGCQTLLANRKEKRNLYPAVLTYYHDAIPEEERHGFYHETTFMAAVVSSRPAGEDS